MGGRAGAPKTARAIEKALDLRARCSEAKAALSEAQRALHEADKRDRAEHAQAVAKSPNATLEPKHAEAARTVAEDAERRYQALEAATETAADELIEIGSAEADTLLAAARQVRERSVERVERAAQEIEQALAEQQAATSIAKWAADPAAKRWKVALASGEVGRPGIRIDRIVAGAAGRAHLRGGAGAGAAVVVGGEDHDGGAEADDGGHRDRKQRAQLPVVGAEDDRGVLGGDCLAHDCLLSGDRRLDGSPAGVGGERHRAGRAGARWRPGGGWVTAR